MPISLKKKIEQVMYFNVHVEHVLNLGLFSHFLCYDFFKRIEKIIAAMIIYLHKKSLQYKT